MAEQKNIKNLTLSDLAGLASDIIVGSIERGDFVLGTVDNKTIELFIKGVTVRLWYSEYKNAFSEHVGFESLTTKDSLRCYLNIKNGSKSFDVLSDLFVKNERANKEKVLAISRNKVFELEKELDLAL